MTTLRALSALLILALLAVPLAGCGKKSDLEQPSDVQTEFPWKYPR